MAKRKINYALAGSLVASGMSLKDTAAQCGGTPESVRVGLHRRGVTSRSIQKAGTEFQAKIVSPTVTYQVASQAAEVLKETFNSILIGHVGKLAEIKPSSNMRKLKQIGQVIEPLARTYRTVNPEQAKSSLVNVNVLSSVQSWDDLPSVSVASDSTPALPDTSTDQAGISEKGSV